MPFDLSAHLGAMTRSVENIERDGRPAKAVVASRVFETDPADLWNALTDPQRLPRWFAPVSGDLCEGGRYQVEGNAGGTITECVPGRRVAMTWEFGGGISWVTVILTPEGSGTRLELRHVAHVDPHWDMFGPGAVGVGWDLGCMGLARHLAEPAAKKPQEAEAEWMASAEAKRFIGDTSAAWGEAAIASGEEASSSRAAAESTRKFYTGEMPPAGI